MKRKVLVTILSAVVVAGSIIGCGKTDNQETDIATTETEAGQESTATSDSQTLPATFEELVNSLQAGQSYAYAPICEGDDVLLVTSYTFDDLEGHQATFEASIYVQKTGSVEKVRTVQGGGTAYPIAVTKDNNLILCMRNSMQKAYIDKTSGQYVVTEESSVDYITAEDGDYHNYVKDSNDVPTDSSLFDKLSDEYFNSEVLSFESAGISEDGAPHFAGAVYSAYVGDDLYNVVGYIAFESETAGYTQTPDGMTGLPFDYEVNGEDIVFHFGSADDTSKAKFGFEYASYPTLTFSEGSLFESDAVTLTCIGSANPEAFDAAKYYDNDANLYMQVTSYDTTSLTGDLFRKEKIKKEYVENAEEGSFIYSVNGTQFKVASFEDANKELQCGTDEEFKASVVGGSRFDDFLVYDTEDDAYYALQKGEYDEEYQVVAMMHEEDIMKRIENNVTFKIRENCEITLQKFVSDGEFMELEPEYTVGREFKGDNYPQWSATADEYYMTDGMLVAVGVIDDELYNFVQIYVP